MDQRLRESIVERGPVREERLSLAGAVAMGTGVMVGAGIFALTGQVAQLAGAWFPLAFVLAAIIGGLSAHSYITVSRTFPSAGGDRDDPVQGVRADRRGSGRGDADGLLDGHQREPGRAHVRHQHAALFGLPPTSGWVPVLVLGVILAGFGVNLLADAGRPTRPA
jgi:hypothetical protein